MFCICSCQSVCNASQFSVTVVHFTSKGQIFFFNQRLQSPNHPLFLQKLGGRNAQNRSCKHCKNNKQLNLREHFITMNVLICRCNCCLHFLTLTHRYSCICKRYIVCWYFSIQYILQSIKHCLLTLKIISSACVFLPVCGASVLHSQFWTLPNKSPR